MPAHAASEQEPATGGEDSRPMLAEALSADVAPRRGRARRSCHVVAACAAALLGAAVACQRTGGLVRGRPKSEVGQWGQPVQDAIERARAQEREAAARSMLMTPPEKGSARPGNDCVRLPGIRLADGKGGALDTVHLGGPSADACADACVLNSSCKQAIYVAWDGTCYMFGEATGRLAGGVKGRELVDSSDYHESLYCGMDKEQAEALKKEALATIAAIEAVQEAKEEEWSPHAKAWEEDNQRRQDEHYKVQGKWDDAEKRAWEKVSSMSTYDKLNILHGTRGRNGYAGLIRAVDGAELVMNDGPQGFNGYKDELAGTSTQLPALLSVAASFSRETSAQYAKVVAEEFEAKGSNVLLGPDVEIVRAPLSGRAFETLSGEDPYLGGELVRPFVKAVQERGIVATVKHWLDNNQEIYRQSMNVTVEDRTQHEIYMPVFKAAFDAGAGAVMCAYNKVHGDHACESSRLLQELLRGDLGFRGYVVSDWGATHDGNKAAGAGLDVEMPFGDAFSGLDVDALGADRIGQMAARVLSSMYASGQMDGAFAGGGGLWADARSDWHLEVAKQAIIDGAVLLENKNATLPLQTAGKTIAMVGAYCDQAEDERFKQGSVYSGGGSGYVDTRTVVTPYQGVNKHIGDAKSIYKAYDVSDAKGADVAIVCLAAHAEEGWDRNTDYIDGAKKTVEGLREMDPKLKIVVLAAVPGAVQTEWAKAADAVLMMFMPGEQVGAAFAELITGEASPAGRLPITLPTENEQRFSQEQYPGVCQGKDKWCEALTANFSEGVLVGYRWNDAKHKPAAYPFGYGLTYTEFEFRSPEAHCRGERAVVTLQVANIGSSDGSAVPQLYVGFDSLKPALRRLRGFQKVQVPQGGDAWATFFLGPQDWSFWDEERGEWTSAMSKGEHVTVFLGDSSAHLVWNQTLSC